MFIVCLFKINQLFKLFSSVWARKRVTGTHLGVSNQPLKPLALEECWSDNLALTIAPPCTPLSPPTPFFFLCDMLTEGEARQFTSLPKWGNVRKGTHIKTMLSWRYSMVQKLQTNTYALRIYNTQREKETHTHTHTQAHTHTRFYAHTDKCICFVDFFWANNTQTVHSSRQEEKAFVCQHRFFLFIFFFLFLH